MSKPSPKPKTTLPLLHHSPTNSQHYTISPSLRDTLTSLLLQNPTSIPAIQSAFSSGLDTTGWTQNLRAYALEAARNEPDLNERELVERVVASVRDALVPAGSEGEVKGRNPGVPTIPRKAVDAGVETVKKELEGLCKVADEQLG